MKIEEIIGQRPNEKIIDTVRADYVPFIPWMFFLFLWITVPFFFLFPLWQKGWLGIAIFFSLVLTGLLAAWQKEFSWQRSISVVTDQRLLDVNQCGFFDRVISEVEYQDIEEVTYRVKGLFPTVFRFGTIYIKTAGNAADLELRRVHQPSRLTNLLNDLRNEFRSGAISSRTKKLTALADKLSDEEVERLMAAVKIRQADKL